MKMKFQKTRVKTNVKFTNVHTVEVIGLEKKMRSEIMRARTLLTILDNSLILGGCLDWHI
jgi:hypothetical protein